MKRTLSILDDEQRRFIAEVIPMDLLSLAIDYICKNLSPEDVFDDEQLSSWAVDNLTADELLAMQEEEGL